MVMIDEVNAVNRMCAILTFSFILELLRLKSRLACKDYIPNSLRALR